MATRRFAWASDLLLRPYASLYTLVLRKLRINSSQDRPPKGTANALKSHTGHFQRILNRVLVRLTARLLSQIKTYDKEMSPPPVTPMRACQWNPGSEGDKNH